MHRGHNLSHRVGKQYRDAVGDQGCHGQPGLGGDHRIAGGHRLLLRAIDHSDSPAVHLLHPDQALHRQANTTGKPFPVCSYRFGPITDMRTEVERDIRRC
jgi:hypothetical protein